MVLMVVGPVMMLQLAMGCLLVGFFTSSSFGGGLLISFLIFLVMEKVWRLLSNNRSVFSSMVLRSCCMSNKTAVCTVHLLSDTFAHAYSLKYGCKDGETHVRASLRISTTSHHAGSPNLTYARTQARWSALQTFVASANGKCVFAVRCTLCRGLATTLASHISVNRLN
jgi:hypothetical protein